VFQLIKGFKREEIDELVNTLVSGSHLVKGLNVIKSLLVTYKVYLNENLRLDCVYENDRYLPSVYACRSNGEKISFYFFDIEEHPYSFDEMLGEIKYIKYLMNDNTLKSIILTPELKTVFINNKFLSATLETCNLDEYFVMEPISFNIEPTDSNPGFKFTFAD